MSMSEEEVALEALKLCFGFVPSMVARAVCELGIPAILAAHDHEPMSALHLAQRLSPLPTRPLQEAAEQLDRMMRCLSAYKVFNAHVDSSSSAVKYSSTPISKWLHHGAPYLLLETSPEFQAPWHHFSQSLLHGSTPFTLAHSMDVWTFAAANPSFSRLAHSAMAAGSQTSILALLHHYDGFQKGVRTFVDVGGGIGSVASSLADHYPSIKAINFDLPKVIATAPTHKGVEHIGGDMFESIPPADTIFMKWVLHDWDDEHCIKILHNCHKALPKHGKLIIMEAVLDFASTEESPFNTIGVALDMVMLAHTTGGKQRTKNQWEVMLGAAKFSLHRIVGLPCPQCVIEAIPL